MRYTAIVRIRSGQTVVLSESKTFGFRSAANTWAKRREVALEEPAELERAIRQAAEAAVVCKLNELIRWYIDTFRAIGKWRRSKQTSLEFLERHPIRERDARKLTSQALIEHVQTRRANGTGPATVANDLTWIGVVLRAAKSVKGLAVKPEIVSEARSACRELRLISKSRRRDRRPTAEELMKLDQYFSNRHRSGIPMLDIWHFALESAKREDEICRLEWTDNDEATQTGLVRDAKHPRHKDGNHRRFKYTPEAWVIVQRQPRTSARIFPYNSKSVGTAFTRACKVLGIFDLRFHDGRHEGTSRLFERGYQIHEVAQFTLHESWNELKRYTNLRPENVRALPGPTLAQPANLTTTAPSLVACRSTRRGRSRLQATDSSGLPVEKPGTATS
jgi:integrase